MRDSTNKDFWQRAAKVYAPFMKKDANLYHEIAAAIRPHMTRQTKLLELATGPGTLALSLSDTGASMIATDYSEKMIEAAKKENCPGNVRFEIADATSLQYENEQFDIVLIANALHIMPEPEKALAQIHRVLKPGGLLIAPTFVHAENQVRKLRFYIMELIGFHTYHRWSGKQLAAYIAKRNFKIQTQRIYDGNIMPLSYIEAIKI